MILPAATLLSVPPTLLPRALLSAPFAEVQIFPEKVWLDSVGGLSPNLEFSAKSLQTLLCRPAQPPNWVRLAPQATPQAAEVEPKQV